MGIASLPRPRMCRPGCGVAASRRFPIRTRGPGPPEGHGTWGGFSGKERTALKREASLANGTKFGRPPQGRRHGAYGHHTGKAIAKYVGVSRTTLDASEDLSAQILNNPDLSQKLLDELVPIIYKGLKATA